METTNLSLPWASLKLRLIEPRPQGLFTASPKFGPGLRARAPACSTFYLFLQLFDETKKWDDPVIRFFFCSSSNVSMTADTEKSKTNRIRRRCIFRSEGFVGSDLSTSIDGCLITDQLFLCLETPLIRKVACWRLATNLKAVRYDSAQW